MSFREVIVLIISVGTVILAVVALVLYNKRKRDIIKLAQSVDTFIETGKLTDFSTADNSFARLQNSISDLENLIKLEENNAVLETKKSAEFIADVSHQLKTPLAGLRLYCEMEHLANPSEHTKKELQLIDKMESLIYKLLRLEKIKADTYTMDFQFYEVKDIIDELVVEFQALFKNKKYVISGNGTMRCDREWLTEAIGNTIKNASEHTADDGRIEIIIQNSQKSTTISVSDNGSGVDEEELPKLFSRFHRTQNANINSAGIGLAITKAIIEKHHGTISAENREKGLSVIMCFPHIDGYITM